MPELTDADVFGTAEMSDADVFGSGELSDADIGIGANPLQTEMAAAGVNLGATGPTTRPPQATPDDQLQSAMLQQAATGTQFTTPETGGERVERLIGYGEQVLSDLANPPRYFARLADIPIDLTLNRDRPELQGATERAVQIPGISLPKAGEAQTPAGKAAAGTYNAVAELVEMFTTPEALVMLPAGANKTVLTGWASQMAAHAPEQFAEAYRLAKEGKTQEAWQAGAVGGGTALMAWLAARHAMGERLPRPEGEPARGELPDPDTVARNLAAPGTLRPQELQAMAPPEVARPDMVQFERVPLFNEAGEVIDVQTKPRIREVVVEDAPRIEPVTRQLKPDVEGGKLPERPQPFERTAEDILAEKAEAERLTEAEKPVEKPGLISGTAAEAWADRVIGTDPRTKTRTTIDPLDVERFSAYVVKGAAILERGVRKFSDWSLKMIAEYGDGIRPHLRSIYEQANAGLDLIKSDETGLKQRRLATRGAVSPEVPTVHQERLKTGREAFYEPQDVSRIEDSVSHLSSEELAAVPVIRPDGQNNMWTAAQLELYRRNVAGGNLDAAWGIMEQAMKTGTTLGQLVNQFKLLRGATPDGVMVAVNRRLAQGGFDPMRPSEQMRTRRLAEESIKRNAEWKQAERIYREKPTPENFEQVSDARDTAVEADVAMQQKLAQYEPRSFFDMLTTLLKGNLLAPISQAANIAGNTTNLLIRGGTRGTANVIDTIDSFLRSRPRQTAETPLRGTKESAKAIGRAVPSALKELWHGTSDAELSKVDVRRGLRPLVAMRDLFKAQAGGPTRGGATPVGQRLLMALEASPFAMHATAQLRLLGAVDQLYKAPARARLITEAMKLADKNRPAGSEPRYTSENVAMAVKYPELFFDKATMERIDAETAYAVYQNRNPVSTAINRALAGAKPSTRFMVATLAPYITTPTNVIGEWLSYNPLVAAINFRRHSKAGRTRAAETPAGKFVMGSMAMAAGYWLYDKGLISPSLDQPDEQQKARILSGQTMPPRHINISGLKRALKGEDSTFKPGDTTIDVLRAGGVAGAMMLGTTDVMYQRESEPAASGSDYALRVAGDQWTQMLQYGVNQSFLKGTANLLDAIQEGKPDSWFAQYAETLSAIPLPGTMNALARATREFKPEVRGDSLDERLENQLRSRLGVFGADDKLPLKRDLWGRPIKETPEGATPWLYQTLDVSKAQKIPQDSLALLIYGLWRKTGNLSVIPTPPDRSLTVGRKTYDLTREDVSRLQEITGQLRYQIGNDLMLNPNFINAPNEAKIEALSQVWQAGGTRGKMLFLQERLKDLKRRP